jgi:hypothetical protein
MNQLFQIIISIFVGFLYAFIFKLINKKLLLTTVITTILTVGYVILMYYINLGVINYILKLSIILGFIIFQKCKIFKKNVK